MASVFAALMMTSASAAAPTSGKSWSPPFQGKFTHHDSTSAHRCASTVGNTTAALPSSNLTTGISHLADQTTANASTCPTFVAHGEATSVVQFTTSKFSLRVRMHHIAITWSLRWFSQVISSGGRLGPNGPAVASYTVGLDGSGLCAQSGNLTKCMVFPNSSAPGSNNSVGWYNTTTDRNGSFSHLGSATVTLYLNGTFGGNYKFWIYTSIFASVDAKAQRGTAHAHAIVLFSPILGGYAKLVGITVT